MTAGNPPEGEPAPEARVNLSKFDVGVAHSARVYDYWLGGKDNFAADREAAESVIAARPTIVRDVRENRAFMRRAVAYLAAEAGMRQFLDIGTGIPTSPNLHEVAQGIAPEARIVYADNDPIVLSHAKALLTSSPQGATAYIDADLREPGAILKEAVRTLDFARPVAVVLVGILFLISDGDDPYGIVAHLMDAVASGSYLVITHPASDVNDAAVAEGARRYNQSVATRQTRRSFTEVTRFLEGLDVVPPGLVQCHRWRPGPGIDVQEYEVSAWAAVARKR
jgi:S-adenosyl methyltransferase